MTWSIPIGEVFEAFINWLTDSAARATPSINSMQTRW